jgi:hypothetical protein
MMEPPELRPGDRVEVDFLDHMESDGSCGTGEDGLAFKLIGRLVVENPRSYVIETWCYPELKAERDANVVLYTILKSAVQNIFVLHRPR